MDKSKKIIVCGDSFCAADNFERNHFSQILEDQHGYKVVNFARGGTDNTSICFQLQQAIDFGADIIICATTDAGRMTVPLTGNAFNQGIPPLKNFAYAMQGEDTYGKPYVGGADADFVSMPFNHLVPTTDPRMQEIQDSYMKLPEEIQQAVKIYLTHLHDSTLKRITDHWMLDYWKNQVQEHGIQLILFKDADVGGPAIDFGFANPTYPKVYHTDHATQLLVVNNILKKINATETL